MVVVGGGFGGATAARYLKMWGGKVDVTLVERNAEFISCPIRNLVLGGHKQMADITRGYDGLKAMGIKVVQGDVMAIDAAGKKVRLASGGELPYDRLVLSPGIDFMADQVGGLQAALDSGRIVHGWKAGPQTVALRKQIEAMPDGGVFALVDPQGALPLPARAVRARLHGGELPEGGQAEVEGAGPGRQPRDPVEEGAVREGLQGPLRRPLEYRPELRIEGGPGNVAKLEFEDVRPTC